MRWMPLLFRSPPQAWAATDNQTLALPGIANPIAIQAVARFTESPLALHRRRQRSAVANSGRCEPAGLDGRAAQSAAHQSGTIWRQQFRACFPRSIHESAVGVCEFTLARSLFRTSHPIAPACSYESRHQWEGALMRSSLRVFFAALILAALGAGLASAQGAFNFQLLVTENGISNNVPNDTADSRYHRSQHASCSHRGGNIYWINCGNHLLRPAACFGLNRIHSEDHRHA